MARLGIMRGLLVCGVAMALSNLVFVLQAWAGPDLGVLALTVSVENITTGMGMTAFVAYMSSLCNVAYTATQYALLTSLMAMGRTVLSSGAGWLAEQVSWPTFFVLTTIAAAPGLLLLLLLMRRYQREWPGTRADLAPCSLSKPLAQQDFGAFRRDQIRQRRDFDEAVLGVEAPRASSLKDETSAHRLAASPRTSLLDPGDDIAAESLSLPGWGRSRSARCRGRAATDSGCRRRPTFARQRRCDSDAAPDRRASDSGRGRRRCSRACATAPVRPAFRRARERSAALSRSASAQRASW